MPLPLEEGVISWLAGVANQSSISQKNKKHPIIKDSTCHNPNSCTWDIRIALHDVSTLEDNALSGHVDIQSHWRSVSDPYSQRAKRLYYEPARRPIAASKSDSIKIWQIMMYTNFVVEPAFWVKEFKKPCICFRAPEIHIGNLEITPNYPHECQTFPQGDTGTYNGRGCMFVLRHLIRTRASSLEKCIEDTASWILPGCKWIENGVKWN
jgi:hypothetical protein